MNRERLRVWFETHHDGRLSGRLLRTWEHFLDEPPPAAWGRSEGEVYRALELKLHELELTNEAALESYFWEESLEPRTLTVEVHPALMHRKRPMVGEARVPLKLTYASAKTKSGAFRVLLPRFGWSFMAEDLSVARAALQNTVAAALLGENPAWLYDFRCEGEEYVRAWEPRGLVRELAGEQEQDDPLPAVETVADDLTSRLARGRLPPLVMDERAVQPWLPKAGSTPRSILLVGEPGVGKTSWVLQLAHLLSDMRRRDKTRRWPRLWRTSASRLVAGMIYLGQWQERCLDIVDELSDSLDWLFVDRLGAIVAPQSDGASIASLLLPPAQAGDIGLIAECSEAELDLCERRSPSVLKTFALVRLTPPAPVAVPALAERWLASRKGPSVHHSGLERLVTHLELFERATVFPGKAYRFLEWLHAQERQRAWRELPPPERRAKSPDAPEAEPAEPSLRTRTLLPSEVSETFSRYTGLPLDLISDERPAGRATFHAALAAGVVGQDAACEACASVLARLKTGLNDPDRPAGTLLFAGPTGVGKTELARQLARVLFGSESRLVRLDMSEYLLPGSSRRLTEVGPGVTSLAQRLRSQPLSVVLLDEIEKAHPEVFDLLLGVLGEGRLADTDGRPVDFRMAVVVMTSNLGVSATDPTGFGAERDGRDFSRAVREAFRPEFVNRLDHLVAFRALSLPDMERIVELELAKAGRRTGFLRRRVRLHAGQEARGWLARHGHDPKMGARPLKRLIEERVIAPVAVRMAGDPALLDLELDVVVDGGQAWESLSQAERARAVVLR